MSVFIEGIQYLLTFEYNNTYDFFKVSVEHDEQPLLVGEKIVIDKPLFTTRQMPWVNTLFLPMDLSNEQPRITFDNMSTDVFIYVFERANEDSDYE